MPVAAGMVETFRSSQPTEVHTSFFHIPAAFIAARARYIDLDLAMPVGMRLPAGYAGRNTDMLPVSSFRTLQYSQRMFPHFGIDHVAGLKISEHWYGTDQEHSSLWLFQESDSRALTWRECRLLELLHTEVQAALARMRLPLLTSEPLRFQLQLARRVGAMVLRPGSGELLEINQRLVDLAYAYTGAAPEKPWRRVLEEFNQRILQGLTPSGHVVRYMSSRQGEFTLQVRTHFLSKDSYPLDEDVLLVEVEQLAPPEVQDPAPQQNAQLWELSSRQREIAHLLAYTGLSYKEVAQRLGLSEGTVRKHTERLYRALGVHSRPELAARLRGA